MNDDKPLLPFEPGFKCSQCSRPAFKTDSRGKALCAKCANYRGGTITGAAVATGRNDPCPCASGKKYKACCGRPNR